MNRRRGTMLVELMVVITGCAAMLSLSSQLIHRALRAQSESRRVFDGERTAWRLAQDFRRDVHAAETATSGEADGGDELLRLELPEGRSVVYRREEAGIVRTQSRPDGPDARESYPLPARAVVKVEVDEQTSLATLSIGDEAEGGAPPPTRANDVSLHVEVVAQAGRDHRFSASTEDEEATP